MQLILSHSYVAYTHRDMQSTSVLNIYDAYKIIEFTITLCCVPANCILYCIVIVEQASCISVCQSPLSSLMQIYLQVCLNVNCDKYHHMYQQHGHMDKMIR